VHLPFLKVFQALIVLAYIGLGVMAIIRLVMFEFGSYFGWLFLMAMLLLVGHIGICLLSFNAAELEVVDPDSLE